MYFDIVKLDPVNNYYIFSPSELSKLKKTISDSSLNEFEKDMECLFLQPLESVVTKKSTNYLPTQDMHDYVSLATYFWSDSSKENGLPFIEKDGQANPMGNQYDKDKLRRLAYLVYHAGMLYYLTDQKKYYLLLKKHLIHWFIDSKTRMNPNMEHGQFVPGKDLGRAQGIIDYSANFTYALHLLTLLNSFGLIEDDLIHPLRDWHQEFKNWLINSEIGQNEYHSTNNHGTFYDLALLVINLFLNETRELKSNADKFLENRVLKQIVKDGSLPQEIRRTKSKSYTFMALKGILDYGKILDEFQINIWKNEIKECVNWLFHYEIEKKEMWPYKQITEFDEGIYIYFIVFVVNKFGKQYLIEEIIDQNKLINKVPKYLYLSNSL